ncbi:MAG: GLPGLI family protein [Bacteroidota bacterium]|jgi:GLPGLI family protein
MKKIFLLLVSFISIHVYSQSQFITKGRIMYEKTVNQHKPLEEEGSDNDWWKEMMKSYPKLVKDQFELKFNETKSVYKLQKENTDNKYMWGSKPNETDNVINDITNQSISIQREIFENTYLIKDSLRNFEWKITQETREIAGFECKKAVTKICDSVVVVAFYTDQIPVSAGPESMGGLPGMILGLAIPRMYTTWFATKLELVEPTIQQLNPIQKGKKVNWVQLNSELKKGMKDWGKNGHRLTWGFSL